MKNKQVKRMLLDTLNFSFEERSKYTISIKKIRELFYGMDLFYEDDGMAFFEVVSIKANEVIK